MLKVSAKIIRWMDRTRLIDCSLLFNLASIIGGD
jgi:hypothetical protein